MNRRSRLVLEERMLATVAQQGAFPDGLTAASFLGEATRLVFDQLSQCYAEWSVCDTETLAAWLSLSGWPPERADAAVEMLDLAAPVPESLTGHYVAVLAHQPDEVLRGAEEMSRAGRPLTAEMRQRAKSAWLSSRGAR